MRRLSRARLHAAVVTVVVLATGCAVALLLDQMYSAHRSQIEEVQAGMTKAEVTEVLGFFYDEIRAGESSKVDRVIQDKQWDAESVQIYRIAGSRDSVWIGYGPDRRVRYVWLDE